jgi:hypothetical protein
MNVVGFVMMLVPIGFIAYLFYLTKKDDAFGK